MTAYRATPVDPARYRPAVGRSASYYATEQDTAAGTREARLVLRGDGTPAAASVSLRCYQTRRRVYAYLRWYEGNTTREKYLGDVSDYPDRASALRAAWQRVQAHQPQNTHTNTTAPSLRG